MKASRQAGKQASGQACRQASMHTPRKFKGARLTRHEPLDSHSWTVVHGSALVSYNAGISACEKGGQWPEALSLLREMGELKVEPSVISYSTSYSIVLDFRSPIIFVIIHHRLIIRARI